MATAAPIHGPRNTCPLPIQSRKLVLIRSRFFSRKIKASRLIRLALEQARGGPVLTNVRVDWKETPEAHVFRADLPGVKKEAAKVEVEDGNVLVISGERAREEAGKDEKWRLVERSCGRFQRRFRLPRGAKLDQVRASMDNGVLTVTVPKEEVKKPQVRAVEISG